MTIIYFDLCFSVLQLKSLRGKFPLTTPLFQKMTFRGNQSFLVITCSYKIIRLVIIQSRQTDKTLFSVPQIVRGHF